MVANIDQTKGQTGPGIDRRNLLSKAGIGTISAAILGSMGPVGAILASGKAHAQSAITDSDILNFALNLEYLEAEYYLRGVTGVGLPQSMRTGVGTLGTVNGGTMVPFANPVFFEIAAKISVDETAHVNFIRSQLGSAAIASPTVDLAGAFQGAALAAGAIPPNGFFNPFGDEVSFMLGAMALEEVGVTAYAGAAALISSPTVLSYAASILAVEAYHAGAIRGLLTQTSNGQGTPGLANAVADQLPGLLLPFQSQAIANLQSKLSGAVTAQGIVFPGSNNAQIAARDANALAFTRTTTQVLNVVEAGGAATHAGGFFPNGVNGNIR